VLIAPWGGQSTFRAFAPQDLKRIATPLLFLVGDRDDISGYQDGVRTLFDGASSAPRRMLVFENGGHTIGMTPAPDAARERLVTEAFFEDPVWRKDRVLGISQHVITAFLDLHLKGDASKAAYLDPQTERSADGAWPVVPGADEAAISSGQPGVTVWRGFQRRWAEGLRLLRAEPSPPAKR
jgi:hypothetical protein